jgi:hypothetical protein
MVNEPQREFWRTEWVRITICFGEEAKLTTQKEWSMKFIINRVMVAFLLVTLAGAAAFAKSNTGTVSISSNIKVNGTLVKKGNYDVRFDEKTGELTVAKDGKVVAKTVARLEKRFRKAAGNEVQTSPAGMEQRLVAITFGGSNQNIVVNQDGMQAAGN